MSYLLDTNILIKYYAEDLPEEIMNFVDGVMESSFNISFVNRIEVLGYPQLTQEQIAELEESFQEANEYLIDEGLVESAILIARTYNFRAADAIIAATAIANNHHLITNDGDFIRAHEQLTVVDPFVQIPPHNIV